MFKDDFLSSSIQSRSSTTQNSPLGFLLLMNASQLPLFQGSAGWFSGECDPDWLQNEPGYKRTARSLQKPARSVCEKPITVISPGKTEHPWSL